MNFNDLFYKPKRAAKKTQYQRLRNVALFLSVITTLGILGYIVFKNSNNRKTVTNVNSYSMEDINKNLFKAYLNSVSNIKLQDMISFNSDFINEEEYSLEDYFREVAENIEVSDVNASFRDNVVETILKVREALKDIPNEDKYNYVLEHYKMLPFQFDDIQAVTGAEAKPDKPEGSRYIDAFTAINNMYNRTRSYKKCGYARVWLNKSGYITLHEHVTAPGQYTTYKGENYYKYLGSTSGEHYQAVLDFLCVADFLTESTEYVNPFLDFRANGQGINERFTFVKGGNEFSYKQPSRDRIPLEELYYYIEEEMDDNLESSDDKTLTLSK